RRHLARSPQQGAAAASRATVLVPHTVLPAPPGLAGHSPLCASVTGALPGHRRLAAGPLFRRRFGHRRSSARPLGPIADWLSAPPSTRFRPAYGETAARTADRQPDAGAQLSVAV